jgi:hypothetical protein
MRFSSVNELHREYLQDMCQANKRLEMLVIWGFGRLSGGLFP